MAGDGGAFGQVAARGGGWCSRSCPFPRAVGVGEGARPVPVAAPLALVAGHFAPLVPGQSAHRAVGQCADAAGEGALRTRPRPPSPWGKAHQDEAAGGALDQGRPSRWPRFLPMIRSPS